jgi:hypothetical protein
MEAPMETTLAAHTRDFARRFFTLIEELDPEDWMSANDAFAQTLAAHPDHPYAVYIRDDRARRAGFSAAAESIREAEFPQIERRKAGIRGNAPVFYRTWRPGTGINLDLPHQVPSGHPLRTATEDHHPLRREPETEPRAPWRRRSNALRARSGEPAEDRHSRLAGWWHAVTRR